MVSAVLVDVVRTAGGKRKGSLKGWHAADLAAEVLKAVVARNDLDPGLVDDVIVAPALSDDEAKERFPKGFETKKPYLRVTPQPNR